MLMKRMVLMSACRQNSFLGCIGLHEALQLKLAMVKVAQIVPQRCVATTQQVRPVAGTLHT